MFRSEAFNNRLIFTQIKFQGLPAEPREVRCPTALLPSRAGPPQEGLRVPGQSPPWSVPLGESASWPADLGPWLLAVDGSGLFCSLSLLPSLLDDRHLPINYTASLMIENRLQGNQIWVSLNSRDKTESASLCSQSGAMLITPRGRPKNQGL